MGNSICYGYAEMAVSELVVIPCDAMFGFCNVRQNICTSMAATRTNCPSLRKDFPSDIRKVTSCVHFFGALLIYAVAQMLST